MADSRPDAGEVDRLIVWVNLREAGGGREAGADALEVAPRPGRDVS